MYNRLGRMRVSLRVNVGQWMEINTLFTCMCPMCAQYKTKLYTPLFLALDIRHCK